MGLWIAIGVLILIALWAVISYNGFVRLGINCDEAFATMDVYLKKRFDLIPNLVETVKGYAKHESETLEAVIRARSAVGNSATAEEKLKNENIFSGTLKSLFAVAEAYPDLKANTNFIELMQNLKSAENDISNSRKYYNAVIKQFNTKCKIFPSSIIAKIFRFEVKPMFEIEDIERDNVTVDFGTDK